MKNKQQGNVLLALISIVAIFAVAFAAVYGYVYNIIKLVHMGAIEGHAGEFVIRLIGVFTGVVGAVAGYF